MIEEFYVSEVYHYVTGSFVDDRHKFSRSYLETNGIDFFAYIQEQQKSQGVGATINNVRISQTLQSDAPAIEQSSKTREVTEKVRTRAEIFKKIKDANPRLSRTAVANRANEKLGTELTDNDVRNAYRAMGWQWERADRIR